jgi:hypothetical protein
MQIVPSMAQEGVPDLAGQAGFGPPAIAQMPANNLSALFRREGNAKCQGRVNYRALLVERTTSAA